MKRRFVLLGVALLLCAVGRLTAADTSWAQERTALRAAAASGTFDSAADAQPASDEASPDEVTAATDSVDSASGAGAPSGSAAVAPPADSSDASVAAPVAPAAPTASSQVLATAAAPTTPAATTSAPAGPVAITPLPAPTQAADERMNSAASVTAAVPSATDVTDLPPLNDTSAARTTDAGSPGAAAAAGEEADAAESETAASENDSDDRTLPMTDEAAQSARNGQERPPGRAALEAALIAAAPTDEEHGQDFHFPTSEVIESQKAVWIRIFAEFSSQQGVIHDGALTAPIYEELDLTGMSRKAQSRFIRARKAAVAENLRSLAQGLAQGTAPSGEEARLLALFPADVTPDDLRDSAGEVRFQRGLADRFEQGLIESGSYMQYIRAILTRQGVPSDLGFLPHVESSYNYKAYSKFGAAGIWQFTRGTGKQFMQVQYEVDERLDPLIATRAAAKFLRQNYDRLGSWPLAITAYNHGPNSLGSIVARTGTSDLGTLIRTYHGRLFKFASKNFYAEFLAAREVATNYERYFGELALKPPVRFTPVALPFFLSLQSAAETLGLDQAHLEQLNPSLRRPVLLGDKLIPSGFVLRVPHHVQPQDFIASVPASARKPHQTRLNQVRVNRGDSLYSIGRRLHIPWQRIAEANNISRYNRIRPGQRLIIPGPGAPPQVVASAASASLPPPGASKPPAADAVASAAVSAAPATAAEGAGSLALRAAYHPQGYAAAAGDAVALQPAEGAPVFPDLDVEAYDARRRVGIIRSAYGETLGHYSDWAQVTTNEVRALNRLPYGDQLAPGRRIRIPMTRVDLEAFNELRGEYHNSREQDFYSYFGVVTLERVKVRRGDSLWSIAQTAGVPMWLMYRENPGFIDTGLRAGKSVNVPIVEELSVLQPSGRGTENAVEEVARQTAGNEDASRNAP